MAAASVFLIHNLLILNINTKNTNIYSFTIRALIWKSCMVQENFMKTVILFTV